jgi:hypothetical protein
MNTVVGDTIMQLHGTQIVRIRADAARATSKIFVSVSEYNTTTREAFVGDARMTVCNVVPHSGSFEVWIQVEWRSDLPVLLSWMVVNP